MRVSGPRLLSAALGLLLVSSCSGSTSASPEPSAPSPTTGSRCGGEVSAGVVSVWHTISGTVTLDILDLLAEDLERDAGIALELRRFESDSELVQTFALTAEDDRPDLLLVTEQATRALADSNAFVAPDECDESFESDLLPQVAATYSDGGRLLAAPLGVSVPVLVFDAVRLERAGLDPGAPPRTLTELLDASQMIVEQGVADHGLVLSDACGAMIVEQYSAQRGESIGDNDNGRSDRLTTVQIDLDPLVADLTAVRDAVWDEHVKYIGPNPSGFDDLIALTMPEDGAVMAVHTSAALGEVVSLLSNGNFAELELGVGSLPGPGVGSLIGGNALWLRGSSDASETARAWAAIEWLTDPEQLARFDAATGYLPATRSAAREQVLLDAWEAVPQFRVPYEQLLATPAEPERAALSFGPFEQKARALFGLCSDVLEQGADPERRLGAAVDELNRLLAEYEAGVAGSEPPPPPTTVAADQVEVRGRVRCESGAEVVGIWIDSGTGGSGWADRSVADDGWTEFSIAVGTPIDYQLHVGCGGTPATWATSYFSDFSSEPGLQFECLDGEGRRRGRCAVVG